MGTRAGVSEGDVVGLVGAKVGMSVGGSVKQG